MFYKCFQAKDVNDLGEKIKPPTQAAAYQLHTAITNTGAVGLVLNNIGLCSYYCEQTDTFGGCPAFFLNILDDMIFN